MKRCCKRIDITNRILVERAVRDCISGKMNRGDTIRMFSEYSKLPCEIIKKICKEHFMMEGFFLIDSFEGGLSIGSYLSQYLANYYMSYACHYVNEQVYKLRKHRNGATNRVNLVSHALFQMDDILIVSKSLKDLKMAVKRFSSYVSDFLGLEIKETSKFIDLSATYIDILGRKTSRRSLTVRSSNFLRFRRTAKKVRKRVHQKKEVPLSLAKSYIGRYGAIKHSNTQRFQQKYHVSEDIKRCKEIVSTHERRLNNYGKDEIYAAAVKCSILSA